MKKMTIKELMSINGGISGWNRVIRFVKGIVSSDKPKPGRWVYY